MEQAMGRRAILGNDEDGASAVEFALILPVFLLLVMGACAYALYFGAAHSLQQLAADAARASIAGLDPAERASLANGYVSDNVGAYPLLDAGAVTVETAVAGTNQFLVTVTYDASGLPIWNLGVPLPGPNRVIRQRSTIRNGGD
jgi:Flp pilus assembly protein TadG